VQLATRCIDRKRADLKNNLKTNLMKKAAIAALAVTSISAATGVGGADAGYTPTPRKAPISATKGTSDSAPAPVYMMSARGIRW
jgi:hypothetical protein